MLTPEDLFLTCEVRPKWISYVNKQTDRILVNIDRYAVVSKYSKVPAWLVGAIHLREASLKFNTHLANGDPLFDELGEPLKTTHVPAGLGPFNTWEAGAVAAFNLKKTFDIEFWDINTCLTFAEKYNGLGYKKRGIRSPYVWGLTNHQQKGKYVADGIFDCSVMDGQIGVAAIAITIKNRGLSLS